jgi:PAS domain S-box-containing protein
MVEGVRDYAIILLDAHGIVVDWNVGAERIFGYQESEIVGQHFSRFFTAEDIQAGRPEHELTEVSTRGVGEDDNWLVRKDGSRFFASGTTTALREGTLRGYAKIVRDLTERKRLEDETQKRAEQLAEADRRKDEFLAMLSHELRNPLAPIMNALHVLRHDRTANLLLQQARSMIERQVRQMTRLIDDLLDVTRITRGKVQLRREQVDLGVILERAVETARPLIEERHHTLSVTLPEAPVWLDADPARLEQVVGNILTNAAKYTDRGGRIWLSAALDDHHAVVKIKDTGAGIAPELLPDIFDLFKQAERTLDRSEGGLGVGLTLVKSLVELHSGAVTAHSDGLGHGCEFTVELPVIKGPSSNDQASHEAAETTTASLRVLVVDDNMDTADTLTLLLQLDEYEVATANDGIKALKLASTFHPDVILLDLGLPGVDGYEVAKQVRQQPGLEKVVLVAMTGYGQESDRERTHQAGFDFHLVKPTDPTKVQQLLAMLANQRSNGREAT